MNAALVARQVPQLFGDMWCHRGQQLHHRLQCTLAIGRAVRNMVVLLLDQHVVAFHQRRQSRVEAEVAQIFRDALDRLIAQSLDCLALARLRRAGCHRSRSR